MKFIISLFFIIFCLNQAFTQSYNIGLSNNGVKLTIYNDLSAKYAAKDKFNPIDSSYNFKIAVDSILPYYDFMNNGISISSGKIRNINYINVSIPASLINNQEAPITINIPYKHTIEINKKKSLRDIEFFEDFVNIEHIENLRLRPNKDKLLSNTWFDPNSDYLKFFTSQDTPAIILLKDVLDSMPNWKNRNSAELVLYQRGSEIPIYIIDHDGIINENDSIIFMGSRAYGDTTYYENYTDKEAFFLTCKDNYKGSCLIWEDINYHEGEISEKININKHIEKDIKYSTGSLFISDYFVSDINKSSHFDSRTVKGEGWFWGVLTPKKNGLPNDTTPADFLINYQNINPLFEYNEPLNIKLSYSSLQDSINSDDNLPQRIAYYNLIFDINNKINNNLKFTGFKRDTTQININSNELYNGHNILKVTYKQVYNTTNSSLLIDYFNISGKVRAVADRGSLDFIIDSNADKSIKLSNYKSDRLIVINKDDKAISIVNKDNQGFYVRGSADLAFSNYITLAINDSVISANNNGLHFFINKAPDYSEFKYFNFKNNNNEIINYINNLPKNSIVMIANAGKSKVSPELSNIIRQLGAKYDVSNINGNWLFATIIGTNQTQEKYNDTNIVNLSTMFENNEGNTFTFKLNFNNQTNSRIVATDINSAQYTKPIKVSKNNLYSFDNNITAIYITHQNFYQAAEKLKNYRENSQNIKVKLIDIEDIYNQYNYGNESPHAIKNYLINYYHSSFDLPKYLTLIGDATWDPRMLTPNSKSINYMPAYGNPVSDYWYGLLDGENDFDPEIIVGRISVKSNNEAMNVVNKLIQYDTIAPSEWMKKYLFLTGGMNNNERNLFYGFIGNFYSQYITNKQYCNSIDYVMKEENSPSSSSQGTEIREKINEGKIWTIYIGHAASEVFELDGWNASSLSNYQKYGLLTTISCNTGAFAEPNLLTCRNEEYLLVADKGFIGVIGSTTLGFVNEHNYITYSMINLIGDTLKKERNLGEIFYYGKMKMAKNSYQLFTLYQFSLLGDPLTRFRFGKKTDPYLNSDNIKIKIDGTDKQATDNDSLATISGKILNYGYNINKYLELRMIRTYNGYSDSSSIFTNDLCTNQDFNFNIDIKNKPGTHLITLIIDPNNYFDEDNKDNNKLTLRVEVYKDGLIFLDPQANWDVSQNETKIRVLNPLDSTNLFNYFFDITTTSDDSVYSANTIRNLNEFDINENYIDWHPNLRNIDSGSYILKARSVNIKDGKLSEINSIPINLKESISNDRINYQLHTNTSINFEEMTNLHYNKDNNSLQLNKYSVPFKTLSVVGIYDTNMVYKVRPYVNLEVGNHVFVQGYYDRGFNVGVFSSTPNGISTKYRLFDTWGKDASHPASNWYKDSVAVDLVRFLRDSVSENDYLFIGTNGSAFRLPVYFKIFASNPCEGSVDTLLNVFRDYGSLIADTIVIDSNNQGFNVSFTMVGYKGAKIGSIYEAVNMEGDSATTQGELFVFDTKGKFITQKIGEAKKWNKIYLNGKLINKNTKINIKIYGITLNNQKSLLIDKEYIDPIEISEIPPDKFPFLQIECQYMVRDSSVISMINNTSNGIYSIVVDFIPVDELAIVKSETKIANNSQLRGEPSELDVAIQNLSLRSNIDSVNTTISINDGINSIDKYNLKYENIKANTKQNNKIFINTDYLYANNPISIELNKEQYPRELYYFNNSDNLLLNVKKDTIKPTIKLFIDGKEFHKDDYISKLPQFRVELYDNSPLSVTDSNSITVRVNGYLHPYQRTIKSNFEKINNGTNLKAVLTFSPDTLQYEDISIIVYYYDAELNRDTLFTEAKTSLYNAEILGNITYPNPATENINFAIKYKAPDSNAEAIIDIYDVNGNKISTLINKINIGDNVIKYFPMDIFGNSLSSQIYFYRIQVKSNHYVEPKYGKFILVK